MQKHKREVSQLSSNVDFVGVVLVTFAIRFSRLKNSSAMNKDVCNVNNNTTYLRK